MIYVYCQRKSDSAKELVDALDAFRLRRFDGDYFWRKNKRVILKSGDIVICWGDEFPAEIEGVRVLNGNDVGTKYDAAIRLYNAGVVTPRVARPNELGLTSLMSPGWLPRKFNHVGGNDLLEKTKYPDYYSQKITVKEEYRIHSFLGKSIRAGVKVLRDGYSLIGEPKASTWIRSYDGGWRVRYDNFQSNKKMREMAHAAVKALGLDFGAVDMGLDSAGQLWVFEVNRGPGLEGGSITAYVNAIKKWINNESERIEGESVPQSEPVPAQSANPAPQGPTPITPTPSQQWAQDFGRFMREADGRLEQLRIERERMLERERAIQEQRAARVRQEDAAIERAIFEQTAPNPVDRPTLAERERRAVSDRLARRQARERIRQRRMQPADRLRDLNTRIDPNS